MAAQIVDVDQQVTFDLEADAGELGVVGDIQVVEHTGEVACVLDQGVGDASLALGAQVRDVLQRMKNQCVEGKTRITDSLVEDARDLAGMLDDLNISGDPELTRVSSEIKRDLLIDADDLRNSAATRKAVGDRAAELLDSMPWG